MISLRSYRITDYTLAELEQDGLTPNKLAALRRLKDRRIGSRRELLSRLSETKEAEFDSTEQHHILKLSRRGLLRLEGLIPNRTTREWVEAFLVAAILALVLRTFVIAPFKSPSGSMIPTINIGDHIFASMFSYGLPVPFTDTRLFAQPIARGDIVIFPYPLEPDKDYIKRVIGVGGDTVEVRGMSVLINGVVHEEPYAYYDPVILAHLERSQREPPSFGPIRVPPGKLFMMGDNRFNSSDSRVWGFVDANTVKGRGLFIYWSHVPDAGLLGGYQLGRIGGVLH